jgi:hypothetical protein
MGDWKKTNASALAPRKNEARAASNEEPCLASGPAWGDGEAIREIAVSFSPSATKFAHTVRDRQNKRNEPRARAHIHKSSRCSWSIVFIAISISHALYRSGYMKKRPAEAGRFFIRRLRLGNLDGVGALRALTDLKGHLVSLAEVVKGDAHELVGVEKEILFLSFDGDESESLVRDAGDSSCLHSDGLVRLAKTSNQKAGGEARSHFSGSALVDKGTVS